MNKLILIIIITFFSLGGSHDLSIDTFGAITQNNIDKLQGYNTQRIDDDIKCNHKLTTVAKLWIYSTGVYFSAFTMSCIYSCTGRGSEDFYKLLIKDKIFWFGCLINMFFCYAVIQLLEYTVLITLPKHCFKNRI
jgi:hypothetical protein